MRSKRAMILENQMTLTDSDSARFWSKVDKSGDCWIWTAARNAKGYGQIRIGGRTGRMHASHRISLVLAGTELMPDLEVDHLCSNRCCVNPAHLEQVSHAENVARGCSGARFRERDACSRGHSYNEETTYIDKRGSRVCRVCMRIYQTEWRARHKE